MAPHVLVELIRAGSTGRCILGVNFAPGREGWAESRLRLCRATDDSWVADVGGRGLSASSDPSGLVAGGR